MHGETNNRCDSSPIEFARLAGCKVISVTHGLYDVRLFFLRPDGGVFHLTIHQVFRFDACGTAGQHDPAAETGLAPGATHLLFFGLVAQTCTSAERSAAQAWLTFASGDWLEAVFTPACAEPIRFWGENPPPLLERPLAESEVGWRLVPPTWLPPVGS